MAHSAPGIFHDLKDTPQCPGIEIDLSNEGYQTFNANFVDTLAQTAAPCSPVFILNFTGLLRTLIRSGNQVQYRDFFAALKQQRDATLVAEKQSQMSCTGNGLNTSTCLSDRYTAMVYLAELTRYEFFYMAIDDQKRWDETKSILTAVGGTLALALTGTYFIPVLKAQRSRFLSKSAKLLSKRIRHLARPRVVAVGGASGSTAHDRQDIGVKVTAENFPSPIALMGMDEANNPIDNFGYREPLTSQLADLGVTLTAGILPIFIGERFGPMGLELLMGAFAKSGWTTVANGIGRVASSPLGKWTGLGLLTGTAWWIGKSAGDAWEEHRLETLFAQLSARIDDLETEISTFQADSYKRYKLSLEYVSFVETLALAYMAAAIFPLENTENQYLADAACLPLWSQYNSLNHDTGLMSRYEHASRQKHLLIQEQAFANLHALELREKGWETFNRGIDFLLSQKNSDSYVSLSAQLLYLKKYVDKYRHPEEFAEQTQTAHRVINKESRRHASRLRRLHDPKRFMGPVQAATLSLQQSQAYMESLSYFKDLEETLAPGEARFLCDYSMFPEWFFYPMAF